MKTKLVIFGLTGDLGHRKLIPALDSLLEKNEILPDEIEVIGVSRREIQPFEILESSLGFSRAENSKLSKILSFFEMKIILKKMVNRKFYCIFRFHQPVLHKFQRLLEKLV